MRWDEPGRQESTMERGSGSEGQEGEEGLIQPETSNRKVTFRRKLEHLVILSELH